MLSLRDIHHSFQDNRVLTGVDLDIEPGIITGMIGPSGGGKSVLLKIIAGVLAPQHGTVSFDAEGSQNQISLMFQEGALFDSLTVLDNVIFPLVGGRVPAMILPHEELVGAHAKASEILARVGLTKAAQKFPGQLSGGMRRRVSLARALVPRPKFLLLDDPTAGLDPVASGIIMELIVELHKEYLPTTVMVSHDLRRLIPVVDSIAALFDGKIIFSGSVSELRALTAGRVRSFAACRFDFGCAQ